MKKILNLSLHLVLGGFLLFVVFEFSKMGVQEFCYECPNRDSLTWDENIRLSTVIEQYHAFRNWNLVGGILPFLESPTWPPLRSVVSLVNMIFGNSENLLVRESLTGLMFLIFVPFLFLAFFYDLSKSLFWSLLGGLALWSFLVHTVDIPSYTFSSMLETQAMCFELFAIYVILKLYVPRYQFSSLRKEKWFVFLALFGFFFTKYPYGLMLFMAIFIFEFVLHFRKYIQLIAYIYQERYRGIRVLLPVSVALIILALPVLRATTSLNLNVKWVKLLVFYSSLVVFLDLNYFFWKQRDFLRSVVPRTGVLVYVYGFLPALAWIYLNPDRVGSLIDAQMIANAYVKSFFGSLVQAPLVDVVGPNTWVFDSPFLILLLLLVGIPSVFYLVWKKDFKILSGFLVLFLQIFILETTTGNKQIRHLFQFLPALFFVFLFLGLYSIQTYIGGRALRPWKELGLATVLLILVSFFVFPKGLLSGEYVKSHNFCLRGKDKKLFQGVRDLAAKVSRDDSYIIFNTFHFPENYNQFGRLLASDIDLAFQIKTYEVGNAVRDHKFRVKEWFPGYTLLLVEESCGDVFNKKRLEERRLKLKAKLRFLSRVSESSQKFCMEKYLVERN